MTNKTTNSRLLRDDAAGNQQPQFADLPDPRALELGSEAEVGRTAQRQQQQRAGGNDSNVDDDLPEAYRGKSAAELAKIIADKESMIGRQAQEVGTLRQEIGQLRDLSDRLLDRQASASRSASRDEPHPEPVQLSGEDLLDSPVDAITRVVAPLLDEKLTPVLSRLDENAALSAEQKFADKHPSYLQDMNDPAFQEYVRKSTYRQQLAAKAFHNSDFGAADELWTGYEEYRKEQAQERDDDEEKQTQQQQTQQRQQALADAQTVRAGSGGGDTQSKPVYSARKLQEMRNSDPEGYYSPAFQALITAAFREGRVR